MKRGYASTTTSAIAAEAGIAEATLFAAFGSKAGVLTELVLRAVVPEGGALARSKRWLSALEAADPATAVARFADITADIQRRSWKLFELARSASDTDPAVAELLSRGAASRRIDCESFVTGALSGCLRSGVGAQGAADILWVYTSTDFYRLLVDGAGWSDRRYRAWLRRTLTDALLSR
jgi:AcrR family transcriptional regulator